MVLCTEFDICREADVALARHGAGEAATQLGFSSQQRAEIRIIASELARNHLDHNTVSGIIRISGQLIDMVPVLTVCSLDNGPGISNVADVLQGPVGGYRSASGLGAGLASVARLADRFSCCSCGDLQQGCSASLQWQGTAIAARCWPAGQLSPLIGRDDFDIGALVCGQSETRPCGDGIFISSDGRFSRFVLVDSPGKGRGGGETDLIGSMLEQLDLIWPPDHVIESLSEVFVAEPATTLLVLRFDRLLGELRCCRVGNVGFHLLVDDRIEPPPEQVSVEGGHLIRKKDTVYRVSDRASCLMHSDGIREVGQQKIRSLLLELQQATRMKSGGIPRLDPALIAQQLFSRYRLINDDAAICLWNWRRR